MIADSNSAAEVPATDADGRIVLERALREIRMLRAERGALKQTGPEQIAIVGMGHRLPGGADSPERFWNLLQGGAAVAGGAPERGSEYARGGFLRDIDKFDPIFFGISPHDAASIDPQHRLLLEVCWDALEHALIPASKCRRVPVGLFAGIGLDDYAQFILRSGDISRIDGQAVLGSARSMGPGRVAYALGFTGPVMQVDTSCSSSLLAVHLACQSLRNRECDIALAGGVNLILSPETGIALERMGALAADGRCKTFDASADGYARGEGCGIVVLKRLRDAQAEGDRVLAVIAGSAVNHDGRSNGLTAPSGLAQEALLAAALRAAGLKPHAIQYVETHGTGTSLGDPIELLALARILGKDRTDDLYLGSVKTNLGHLEAAAGIAGLIKTVLMLDRAEIPATPHLERLNPRFPWEQYPLRVSRTTIPWPDAATRRAGVSAFGMSGTNVHVILEAAAPVAQPRPSRLARSRHLLCISAKSRYAIGEMRSRYAASLRAGPDVADYTFSARVGRTEWPYRIAVTGGSAAQLADALDRHDAMPAECGRTPRVSFLFTEGDYGDPDLRELLETESEFRRVFELCPAQPLYALQCGLADVWKSWGIQPDEVRGIGAGKHAAAYVRGEVSLEDGLERAIACAGRVDSDPTLPHTDIVIVIGPGTMPPDTRAVLSVAPNEPVSHSMLAALGKIWALGVPVGWAAFDAGYDRRRVSLPAYPYEKRSYWADYRSGIGKIPGSRSLPLPGVRLDTAAVTWETRVSAGTFAFAAGFFPLSCYVVMAMEAAAKEWGTTSLELRRFSILTPLFLPEKESVKIQLSVAEMTSDEFGFEIHSQCEGKWIRHARGNCIRGSANVPPPAVGEVEGTLRHESGMGYMLDPALLHRVIGEAQAALFHGQPGTVVTGFERLLFDPAAHASDSWTWAAGRDEGAIQLAIADRHRRTLVSIIGMTETAPLPIYKFSWEPLAASVENRPAASWLLIPDTSGIAPEFARLLRKAGHEVTVAGDARILSGIVTAVYLAGVDNPTEGVPEAAENLSVRLLGLVQRLTGDSAKGCTLSIVTCGAAAAAEGESANPAASALAGFGLSIAAEHPELELRLIDLDPTTDASGNARMLFQSLVTGEAQPGQPQAWRNGRALVRKIRRDAAPAAKQFQANAGRTYLITGGYGGLGLEAGLWLARRGARNLALLGRDTGGRRAIEAIGKLRGQGINAVAVSADVGNLDQTRKALEQIRESMPPLGGVFHAAGIYADRLIRNHEPGLFAQVFGPKVRGSWNLHTLTLGDPLEFFVLCSSVTSMLGGAGLSNYAAANAFLDGLAHFRMARGMPALSVNWGPWAGVGMAAAVGDRRAAQWLAQGISPMSAGEALAALETLMAGGTAQAGIFHLAAEPRQVARGTAACDRLRGLPVSERRREMIAHVRDTVAEKLGYRPASSLPLRGGFFEIGMDSLGALEVLKSLRASTGCDLPQTTLFAYSDTEALAAHLLELIFPEVPEASPEPVVRQAGGDDEDGLLREIEEVEALLAAIP